MVQFEALWACAAQQQFSWFFLCVHHVADQWEPHSSAPSSPAGPAIVGWNHRSVGGPGRSISFARRRRALVVCGCSDGYGKDPGSCATPASPPTPPTRSRAHPHHRTPHFVATPHASSPCTVFPICPVRQEAYCYEVVLDSPAGVWPWGISTKRKVLPDLKPKRKGKADKKHEATAQKKLTH